MSKDTLISLKEIDPESVTLTEAPAEVIGAAIRELASFNEADAASLLRRAALRAYQEGQIDYLNLLRIFANDFSGENRK